MDVDNVLARSVRVRKNQMILIIDLECMMKDLSIDVLFMHFWKNIVEGHRKSTGEDDQNYCSGVWFLLLRFHDETQHFGFKRSWPCVREFDPWLMQFSEFQLNSHSGLGVRVLEPGCMHLLNFIQIIILPPFSFITSHYFLQL